MTQIRAWVRRWLGIDAADEAPARAMAELAQRYVGLAARVAALEQMVALMAPPDVVAERDGAESEIPRAWDPHLGLD